MVDGSMVEYHGHGVYQYVITLMHLVSSLNCLESFYTVCIVLPRMLLSAIIIIVLQLVNIVA